MSADVGGNVEAAGQIVESDWTDTHKEDTLEVWLEYLECTAIKTATMCHIVVGILAQLIEYRIGKVVVFVNDKVEMIATFLGFLGKNVDLILGSGGC